MKTLVILPVLVPFVAAAVLLVAAQLTPRLQAAAGLLSVLAQALVAQQLLEATAAGSVLAYPLGNWPAPFGIVFAVDRLTVVMLLLTAVVAFAALLASLDEARPGRNFHALWQLQLCGLNGAFLTADLFNLFVFFEVLLAASYALLLLGEHRQRYRAAIHYTVINLAASALFLVAVSLLYGVTGTLNFADLALRVAAAPEADIGLLQAAGLLLLVVFAVKAALLPLYFWLPLTYRAASLPVVTLFAIMTKVGVYAIARILTLVFGAAAGEAALADSAPLVPLALATLLLAALGSLAATELRGMVSYLVIVSAGTMLAAIGTGTAAGIAAGIFYMSQATLAAAAMFAACGAVAAQRNEAGDALRPGPQLRLAAATGTVFFVAAVAIVGLPPLSGFVAKALLIEAVLVLDHAASFIAAILLGSLLVTASLVRAGSVVFWKTKPAANGAVGTVRCGWQLAAALLLLVAGGGITVWSAPVHHYMQEAAAQLIAPGDYIDAVLGVTPVESPATRAAGGQ